MIKDFKSYLLVDDSQMYTSSSMFFILQKLSLENLCVLLSNTTVYPPDVKNRAVTKCVSRYSAWYRIDVEIISIE